MSEGGSSRAVCVAIVLLAAVAEAHPGGLDARGCHRERRTGEVHCHRASAPARENAPAKESAPAAAPSRREAFVAKVIDGDTLQLAGGERVRLIGVDTPETVHPRKPQQYFGKQATYFTRRMAEGRKVVLEMDPAKARTGHRDTYGRTLAYVILPDGRLLNREIIVQGYGFAYTRFPFARMEEFRAAEREAREAKRGLWAE